MFTSTRTPPITTGASGPIGGMSAMASATRKTRPAQRRGVMTRTYPPSRSGASEPHCGQHGLAACARLGVAEPHGQVVASRIDPLAEAGGAEEGLQLLVLGQVVDPGAPQQGVDREHDVAVVRLQVE